MRFGPPDPLQSSLLLTGAGPSNGASFVGPLDAYASGLVGAWSVSRRLLATYTGPLVRVRNDSGVERDIYALGSGDLNTADLLSHCGAGNGTVRCVYSQTGSGIDFGMATAAAQPVIVTAGSLETLNGKPTMRVTGSQCLDSAFAGNNASAMTVYGAGATGTNASGMSFARFLSFGQSGLNDWDNLTARWVPLYRNGTATSYSMVSGIQNTSPYITVADNVNFVFTARLQAGSPVRYLKVNAGTAATNNVASTPNLTFNLSRWFKGISSSDSAELWSGKGSELLAYTTAHSDPTVIQGVVNSYFGAY